MDWMKWDCTPGVRIKSPIFLNFLRHLDIMSLTGFIRELLNDKFKVNLITRPRRFGKTLAMSMLAEFFDIRKVLSLDESVSGSLFILKECRGTGL